MRSREIKIFLTQGHLLFDLVALARKFQVIQQILTEHILIDTVKSSWDTNTKRHGPCP